MQMVRIRFSLRHSGSVATSWCDAIKWVTTSLATSIPVQLVSHSLSDIARSCKPKFQTNTAHITFDENCPHRLPAPTGSSLVPDHGARPLLCPRARPRPETRSTTTHGRDLNACPKMRPKSRQRWQQVRAKRSWSPPNCASRMCSRIQRRAIQKTSPGGLQGRPAGLWRGERQNSYGGYVGFSQFMAATTTSSSLASPTPARD